MPQKPSLQPRSWGTRFDTLPISPPVSPSATKVSPTSAPVEAARFYSPSGKKEDKMPHDASIFVGSLPTNVEQQELTRALYDHLSEHTEVKNIKVIRDSKGGICAFVQCEDAPSAAKLIQNLHSTPPRPFMGRLLRFEPARAFRTLLISYRTPLQYVSPEGVDQSQMDTDSPQAIELELPIAMRISRHKNSRFFSILYNGDATSAESVTPGSRGLEKTLLLSPLTLNGEALRRLSAYFGQLEHFIPYSAPLDRVEGDHADPWSIYPPPHNAPRKAHMDDTCWEVKWNHRDDCVSALTTLRRVPHLTVTWAHQASSNACNQSPHISSPGAAQYPLHVQLQGTPLSASTSIQRIDICGAADGPVQPQLSPTSLKLRDDTLDPFTDTTTGSGGRLIWSEVDFPPLEEYPEYNRHGSQRREEEPQSASITQLTNRLNQFQISSALGDNKSRSNLEYNPLTPPKQKPGPFPYSTSPALSVPASTKAMEGSTDNDARKEVDPTTLFVGGLEMFGPHSWDERRITNLFSKYGGLEHVKVVHPANSRSGFAFVTFNNTDAPLRAVLGENNRTHNGKTLRVQLRDYHPNRSFRPTRPRTQSVLRSEEQTGITPSDEESSFTAPCDTSPSSTEPDLPSFATLVDAHEQVELADVQQDKVTSEASDHTPEDPVPQNESLYREWYDLPSAQDPQSAMPTSGHSFAPPAPNTMHMVPHLPYHMHNGGYYPPPPYMQTYPYPVPFQVPYYGYHYPIHGQQMSQPYFGTANPDQSQQPTSMHPWPSPGFHSPHASYSSQVSRSPGTEQPQGLPAANQPPVAPTGFIQNDQGTLIAMYQPEALDQYMTGAQTQPAVLPSNQAHNVASWSHLQSNTPYRTGAQQTMFSNRLVQPPNQLTAPSWPVSTSSAFQPQGNINQPVARYGSSYELNGRMVDMQQKRTGRRDHYNAHRSHHPNPANRHVRVTNIARPASPRDQSRAPYVGRPGQQASIDWSHWVANR
ncbi:hypothetical protein BDN72DRAFT_38095 [Pluteus cervinus]|uniref:Uncharacterized protein n=1 Tax=Pluteus cervinus TaxID=181527 RepID=A0ACD3BGJ4_9AGAR|nr:hypothetical protein BDN72DRAFT_38095 [Pluteus cervinus]